MEIKVSHTVEERVEVLSVERSYRGEETGLWKQK